MSFDKLVVKPLFKSIKEFENNNAFCINNQYFSFREFGIIISKIRNKIRNFVDDEDFIGLVTNDDIETYASIIAIWLEGKAYVPLHALQPIQRSIEIIEQVGIKTIFDSEGKIEVINTKTLNTKKGIENEEFIKNDKVVSEESIIYILFTSGTTGKPKGVKITRKNIASFVESFFNTGIQLNENDKCLQCFDLTFDVSVQSFLVPLLRGACIYTIPTKSIKYSYTYYLLEEYQLTFGAMAPSMLRFLRPYFNEIRLLNMRYCILTAEASPSDLVAEWQKCIPNSEIFDFYGPTEGTIYCSYHKINFVDDIKSYNGLVSIGRAMSGISTIIIDSNNKTLSNGEKGELCISGNQLTPGYWKNDVMNASSFFSLVHNNVNTIFYRTGDLCYFDSDGDIMYCGRLDNQVKIQGYRVELGEIEFHSRTFLGGINTIAIPIVGLFENIELGIIIESKEIETKNLQDYLKSKLPTYMIPSKFFFELEFPINANGKIDRNKLKNKILN